MNPKPTLHDFREGQYTLMDEERDRQKREQIKFVLWLLFGSVVTGALILYFAL